MSDIRHRLLPPMDKGGGIFVQSGTVTMRNTLVAGNTGNSEVASGPSIAGFRPDRAHLVIKPNNLFAFEFIAYTSNPDWSGRKVRFNIEDNAIVTENGVEWLYTPNEQILLIH